MPPTEYDNPTSFPIGPPGVDGTTVTYDELVNPPSNITVATRDLVVENEMYIAEMLYSNPGWTVQGGAVIYEEDHPQFQFLDPDRSIRSRAPGAEAPIVGIKRRGKKIAVPESLSGAIEVTLEAKQRGQAAQVVLDTEKAMANTIVDQMNTRALAVAQEFIDANSLIMDAETFINAARATGTDNVDPFTMPAFDLRRVINYFVNMKGGFRPDAMFAHIDDVLYLDALYPDGKLDAMLKRLKLQLVETTDVEAGAPIFAKKKSVGVIAWEQPWHTVPHLKQRGFKDIFESEGRCVFVANNAMTIVRLEGWVEE